MRNRDRTFAMLGALLAVLIVTVVIWMLLDSYQAARRQAEQQEKNVLLALESGISRAIIDFDLGLQSVVKGMAAPGINTLDPQLRQALLFNGVVSAEGFGAEFVSNETGWMIYSSLDLQVPHVNLSDRSYFVQHRNNPNLGLVVSEPLVSRVDGAIGISLSRRINHPDGSFAGIVSGTLKLSYFDRLFRSLDIGKNGVVNIIRFDGMLISRMPHIANQIGLEFHNFEVFQEHALRPAGSFVTIGKLDGIERLYTYRTLPHVPLIIGIGFATSEVYRDWREKTVVLSCIVLILTALGGFLAGALSRELQQRTEAEVAAKHAAQQHEAARAKLDALFYNSADIMMVACAQPNGIFVYEAVNPVWEKMTGVSASAAIGRSPLECHGSELADVAWSAWQTCIDQQIPIYYSFQISKDQHDWEAVMSPVFSEDGRLTRLISVGRDMTEHHALQAKLQQAQRMEAVGQFTAGVAHDFNNMLQAITSALEILQEQPALDEEGTDSLRVACGAAHRGAKLVHRLLAFSRKQLLQPILLCPRQLVYNMEPLLKHSLERHVKLEIQVDDGVRQVRADGSQLEQCLLNLVINARDAMPTGGVIRLRVCNAGHDLAHAAGLPPDRYVCFCVDDNGPGMPPEIVARALEPFFTTKEVGKGTGLGLSMVHGFAKQSGGDVLISSVLGQGTTVVIWLPCAEQAATEPHVSPDRNNQTQSHDGLRVLVVDDEASVRETVSILLRRAGYTPVMADDGWEALELLRAGEIYDLLLTDQSMPGLKGNVLIEEAGYLNPGLPTLLMTGYDHAANLENPVGPVGVLQKPFTHAELLLAIEALLAPKTAHATLETVSATMQ